MLKIIFYVLVSLFSLLTLDSCSMVTSYAPSTDIDLVNDNIYEIMDVDYRGIFGSENSLIHNNVARANEFAEKHSMVAVPIEARIHRVGTLADWAWFYYKFAIVAPSSPKAKIKFEDIVLERDVRLSDEFYKNRHEEKSDNKYEDLMKLGQLRDKGLISEEEFLREKQMLLEK